MFNTKISRRTFLGTTVGAAAGLTVFSWGFSSLRGFMFARAESVFLWDKSDKLSAYKLAENQRNHTICPYCAVGCSMIVTVKDGAVINIEGDPYHPINEGTLCSKGNGYLQLINSDQRITKPMKRTAATKGETVDPGWTEITWDEAFSTIAEKVKGAMDNLTITHDDATLGVTDYYSTGIDHTIAMHGSSYFNNEDCYLSKKIISILGSSENEHQARKCHASTVAGLGSTFGFGAMTNHFIDIKNTKRILMLGSNAAENHPVSFKWVRKAIENNDAKLIVLDPRYTRSASQAHLYAKFRSGSDTAIFLGIINYLFNNPDRIDKTFLESRTNAPYSYSDLVANADTVAKLTLDDADSVYTYLKGIAADYTTAEVSRITGIPEATFTEICDMYTQETPGTIMYSMGTTQHTNATHYIRAYAILQLMLGNIGTPGGGVNALRGISNVQGSTDMNLLSHYVMGYRGFPRNMDDVRRYQKWKNADAAARGGVDGGTAYVADDYNMKTQRFDWRHFATWNSLEYNWGVFLGTYPGTDPDTESAICDLPIGKGNPTIQLFRKMLKGGSANDGYDVVFIFGENNAVSNANSTKIKEALAADNTFVVVYENFDHETAHFADILLPATLPVERYGTLTNSGRWVQWRGKAVDPPESTNKPELEFLTELFAKIREGGVKTPSELYAAANSLTPADLKVDVDECWPSPYYSSTGGPYNDTELEKLAIAVYREIGASVADATKTNSKGVTVQPAANVLHKTSFDATNSAYADGVAAKRRDLTQDSAQDKSNGYFKNWAWSWMLNQRILYYKDEDPAGLAIFFNWWAWTDNFYPSTPDVENPLDIASIWSASRFNRTAAETEFGAKKEKHPLYHGVPVHNEPVESPSDSLASDYPTIWDDDPVRRKFEIDIGHNAEYPYVLTTFRLTEHMQAGAMTRNVPWLIECHPEPFLEISKELGKELESTLGIKSGDMVNLTTARGTVKVKASVTGRLKPLTVDGKPIHEVAMPWHWGFKGLSTGPSANDVTMDAVDYHANIPETKVCLCKITKGV